MKHLALRGTRVLTTPQELISMGTMHFNSHECHPARAHSETSAPVKHLHLRGTRDNNPMMLDLHGKFLSQSLRAILRELIMKYLPLRGARVITTLRGLICIGNLCSKIPIRATLRGCLIKHLPLRGVVKRFIWASL